MRIGVFGGTFDPIHRGHVAAARVAMRCAHLDRVVFVPSAQPPHRGAARAPAADRLAMARAALEGEAGLTISDVEIRRGGPSFTVDTLHELKRTYPGDELYLILGWDAARLFSTWRKPGEILQLASIVVVGRPGTTAPGAADLKAAGLDPAAVIVCTDPTPDVSGSELRRAIERGLPVGDRITPAVERYVAEHLLYRHNR